MIVELDLQNQSSFLAAHLIPAIIIMILPWIFLNQKNRLLGLILGGFWSLSILFLILLYLGFLTYHYMGPQLGFNHQGNPYNWLLIFTGLTSIFPFLRSARNGNFGKPKRTSFYVAFVMLILIGPPIYNSVALTFYELDDGEWDGGEGDFSGEEYDPVDPDAWATAENIGLLICNLIPVAIFIILWRLTVNSRSKNELRIET